MYSWVPLPLGTLGLPAFAGLGEAVGLIAVLRLAAGGVLRGMEGIDFVLGRIAGEETFARTGEERAEF